MLKRPHSVILVLFFVLSMAVVFLFTKLGDTPQSVVAQLTGSAPRAALSVVPESSTFGVGEDVVVSVILSARTKVNVIDVILRYPQDKLEPIYIDKGNSVADLWVSEPTIPGKPGIMQMTAGIIGQDGFSGKGKLITITFRVKSEGVAVIVLADGSVLARDGFGTNVLDMISGAEYTIVPTAVRRSPFDLNGDRLVDMKDIRLFVDGWGKAYDPALDFNSNNRVDFDDFRALVRAVSI